MLVPNIKDSKINNKTIVFNDNVLPLKEEDSSLKLSTIENVSEFSLENCITTIIEHNLDATFHTVQYSKEKKKVYFYADRLLEKKQWYDISKINHQPLDTEIKMLEELRNVLNLSINKNNDCISLYEITNLLQRYNKKFRKFEEVQKKKIEILLKQEYKNCKISFIYFSYPWLHTEDYLLLKLSPFGNIEYEIYFIKKNNNLTIKKSDYNLNKEKILVLAGNSISKAYDGYLEFNDYKTERARDIVPINSNFYVSITDSCVEIKNSKKLNNELMIYCFINDYKNKKSYTTQCVYSDLVCVAQNNEEEIFKKIYVKIEDCPKWMQEKLFCIRQNELTEERRKQEELDINVKKSQVEEQPQKKLSLKNFFFKKK